MLKVLLIDDEPFILQGLSVIIDWENEGYEVIGTCSNAYDALEIINDKQPDLVITDIKMPQMSGLELIEKIRNERISDAYFVLLSGYSDFEYAKRALQNECVDYMVKPVDKQELVSVLAKVKERVLLEVQEGYRLHRRRLDEKTERMVQSFANFDINNEEAKIQAKWNLFDRRVEKNRIDALIRSVEINQKSDIEINIRSMFDDLQNLEGPMYNMVINYMLFQLINLASEEDASLNQQEIMHFISDNAFYEVSEEDGCEHMISLMQEYGDYLSQLRGNQGQGVLGQVECYLRENFKENITLKDLGKKYYINAAYLGQIFKKQYGESFKDYLNRIRIEKAEELLLQTDLKIYEIGEEIGYKDIDYFINKFIAIKGCTPTKYRKKQV